MAVIDYGVIYKVDGKFINKNGDLFEDAPEWAPKRVYELNEDTTDPNSGTDLVQNSYACVGEPNFYIFFYKDIFTVCSGTTILRTDRGTGGAPSIKYFFDKCDVAISHLDKTLYGCNSFDGSDPNSSGYKHTTWKEVVKCRYAGATGNERSRELENYEEMHRQYLREERHVRVYRSMHKYEFYYRTRRFLATWEYGGHKYEVIFGYGIDPLQEVWNRVKLKNYGFTKIERNIVDDWFNET